MARVEGAEGAAQHLANAFLTSIYQARNLKA
jgi:hypothetical protein